MVGRGRGLAQAKTLNFWSLLVLLIGLAVSVVYLGSGNFTLESRAALENVSLNQAEKVKGVRIQYIRLVKGWNLMSLTVVPASYDVQAVFARLVKNRTLELVKNGSGQVYWPAYGINDIGAMKAEEGYWVYVRSDANLGVKGMPVSLPFTINLKSGWSIMSFPAVRPADGLEVVQSLADEGALGVVKDVNGKQIYKVEGVWINEIGQFYPGSAYQIYVTRDATLVIE